MANAVTDILFGSAPSLPPPPDYMALAEANAAGNRVNQVNPWGSSIYTTNPGEETFDQAGYDAALAQYNQGGNQDYSSDSGAWSPFDSGVVASGAAPNRADFTTSGPETYTNTVTLSPEQQALFETNQRTDQQMADIGLMGLGNAKDMFSNKYETGLDPMKSYDDQRQGIMDNMLSRTNTDITRARDDKRSELIARGIPEGSEAYQKEMEQLDRAQVDANQQAELASTQQIGQLLAQQNQTRNQSISEGLTTRNQPLNELNAFRTGNQVSMPNFGPTPLGPDYMGAGKAANDYAMAGYNADVTGRNAMMGGLFGLGAAGIMAPTGTFV